MEHLKVIKLLPLQQGVSERGEWKSQEVVVEATDQNVQYPDRFLLHLSGSAVEQLAGIGEGMLVEAQWSYSVRKYITKAGVEMHQQELRCWKINATEKAI